VNRFRALVQLPQGCLRNYHLSVMFVVLRSFPDFSPVLEVELGSDR